MKRMFGRRSQRALQRKEPLRTGSVANFLSSKTFEIGMLLIILSNTTYIFYQTNQAMRNPQKVNAGPSAAAAAVDVGFLSVYIVEMLLKFQVHRCFFFWNDDKRWNIFDLTVVAMGLFEVVLAWLSGTSAIQR